MERNMYKNIILSFIFLGFSLNNFAESVRADACIRDPGDVGDIPIPFGILNQKLELANGEYYLLEGWIFRLNGNYFFKVDTKIHPYLRKGNEGRSVEYLMVISENIQSLPLFQKLKILVKAEGVVLYDRENNKYEYIIKLNLLSDPHLLPKSKQETQYNLSKKEI